MNEHEQAFDAVMDAYIALREEANRLEAENAQHRQAIADNLQAHQDYVNLLLPRLKAAESVCEQFRQYWETDTDDNVSALAQTAYLLDAWKETKGE